MKKLLVIFLILFSSSTFAKSPSAPEDLYKYKQTSVEKLPSGDYVALYSGSAEGFSSLKDKVRRLATMESLSYQIKEENNQLIVVFKKSLDMDSVIEQVLNDLK